jgi:hypothetical protein
LVHFDSKTNKAVRTSDPALAVYLLQQSIKKQQKLLLLHPGNLAKAKYRDVIAIIA